MLVAVIVGNNGGCANGGQRCLQIPVSNKVSAEAVGTCREAWRQQAARRDLYHRYVQLLRVRGRFKTMLATSRQVLEADNKRVDAHFFSAVALRKLGRCKEALRHYATYAAANRDDPDPHYGIALCREALGRKLAAIEAYRSYIDAERRADRDLWRQRAQRRVALLRGVPAAPRSPHGLRRATASKTKPATATRARAITRRAPARAAAPSAPAARGPAARSAPPANCTSFELAISRDPFATAAYEQFAACAAKRGDHGAIVKRMRVAIRDNPDFNRGWLLLGDAQRALGRAAAAKRAYARACAKNVVEACSR